MAHPLPARLLLLAAAAALAASLVFALIVAEHRDIDARVAESGATAADVRELRTEDRRTEDRRAEDARAVPVKAPGR